MTMPTGFASKHEKIVFIVVEKNIRLNQVYAR